MDFDIKSEITGRFITFGRDFAIGTTEILTRGSTIKVTRAVLMLKKTTFNKNGAKCMKVAHTKEDQGLAQV